jgi:hypothetical protein
MKLKFIGFSKGLILTLIIISLVFSTACSSEYDDIGRQSFLNYQELEKEIEIDKVMSDMYNLLEISPRVASTNAELLAGEYIFNRFSELGLEVEKEEFTAHTSRLDRITEIASKNIIGLKKSSKADAKTLIIGAHYDTVECPGANDNTSGTTVLLEVARILSSRNLDFNIKFIAFGAEEVGLEGSKYHVLTNYPTTPDRNNIIGMINIDMVGMGTYISIQRELPHSTDKIYNLAIQASKSINIPFVSNFKGRSDHVPFEGVGIPVVFLSYGPFPHDSYHNEKDNISIIDQQCLSNTIKLLVKLISYINPDL